MGILLYYQSFHYFKSVDTLLQTFLRTFLSSASALLYPSSFLQVFALHSFTKVLYTLKDLQSCTDQQLLCFFQIPVCGRLQETNVFLDIVVQSFLLVYLFFELFVCTGITKLVLTSFGRWRWRSVSPTPPSCIVSAMLATLI